MTAMLQSFFGRYTQSKAFPLEDVCACLERLCTVPPVDKNSRQRHLIPNSNFKEITDLLKHYEAQIGEKGWAHRPRIYTVLRGIGRLDVMKVFVSKALTDFLLPFDPQNLPTELGDHVGTFVRFQAHVLTDARELELGERGRHCFSSHQEDDHFIRLGYLGAGQSGDVHEVRSRLSHETYARKRFKRNTNSRAALEVLRHFTQEINALKRLSHRRLIKIMGSCTDPLYCSILMSPVADYNLKAYLERLTSRDLPALRSFFGCLANTIAYLHNKQIYHMDIKPENILIKAGDIYLADFGSAHDWSRQGRSTTWSNAPKTDRYIPPELARDPNSPRNWSTDMWCLGVVFLEMTTVLHSKTIAQFRHHLLHNGTNHQFVYGNSPATAAWMEILRESGEGPDSDNEPLVWVKDMTQEQRLNRTKANDRVREILNSNSAEQFRQICCADHDETWEEWEGHCNANEDVQSVTDFEGISIEEMLSQTAKVIPELYQSQAKARPIEAWMSHEQIFPLKENHDTIEYSSDGFTEDEDSPFDIDEDDEPELYSKEEALEEVVSLPLPDRLENFSFLDQESTLFVPGQERGNYDDDSLFEIDSDNSSSAGSDKTVRPLQKLIDELASFEDTPEQESSEPKSSMAAADDAARLAKQVQLEERLSVNSLGSDAIAKSLDSKSDKGRRTLSGDAKIKQSCEPAFTCTGRHSFDSKEQSLPSLDHALKPLEEQMGAASHIDLSGLFVTTSQIQSPNVSQPITKNPRPTSNVPNALLPTSRSTLKNLSKLNSSGKCEAIPATQPSKKRSKKPRRRQPIFPAKKYMQGIWEAESSATTSVVSKATHAKLGGSISITKGQDKTYNYVGYYAKQGNVGALRILLDKECNPGTKENPRKGPMLSAVRGASLRHIKCVRLLLEKGSTFCKI